MAHKKRYQFLKTDWKRHLNQIIKANIIEDTIAFNEETDKNGKLEKDKFNDKEKKLMKKISWLMRRKKLMKLKILIWEEILY